MIKLDSIWKSRDISLPTKVHILKAMVFPVVTYWCESWTINKAECQRMDAFELRCWRRLLRARCKKIKPVNPKGSWPWIVIGKTDAEAESAILWPPDEKSQLIGKDPDAGKDWGQEEKWVVDDEVVGWYHWLDGCEFEQTPGDSEGQGSFACCSPCGLKESNMTEQLHNSKQQRQGYSKVNWWGVCNSKTCSLRPSVFNSLLGHLPWAVFLDYTQAYQCDGGSRETMTKSIILHCMILTTCVSCLPGF